MSRVVIFLLVLTAVVIGAVWFANNPGEVTVIWRGWRMDTSVGVLALLLIVAVAVLLFFAKIAAIVRGTAKGLAAARKERRLAQGLTALGNGLAAAHAGQALAARRFAKEAAALLDDNAATRILTAQAATANDDGPSLRNVAVNLLEHPETELAALRDLAERAQKEGDIVGALGYAKRALTRRDAPKWAFEMALNVQIANGRWADALSALDNKLARDHFGPEAHKKLKAELLIRAAEEALSQRDFNSAEVFARKAKDAGGAERALICHARAFMKQSKQKKAAAEIEDAWLDAPSVVLARVYLEIIQGEPALERARRIEKLVARNPDHPESRLILADASLKAQLWGQARNRLSPLLGDDVPRSIHARAAMLMAELETGERNDAGAGATWLKRALEKTESAAEAAARAPRSLDDLLAVKV